MKVLIVRLLEACNAGCFMCGFSHSQDEYRFTTQDAEHLCSELMGHGVRVVRFTGGEPLLHAELQGILSAFSNRGYTTSLITNGWHLPSSVSTIRDAGLGQVIISLDGANPASHDRFRQLHGLFEKCIDGVKAIKAQAPDIVVRVNTVAGPHNLTELIAIHDLLSELGVQQWSIIPLKRPGKAWEYKMGSADFVTQYRAFQSHVKMNPGIRLLGLSEYWAGRDDAEIMQFLNMGHTITPRGECRLVDLVRYYTPKDGMVYPCNCVPHRQNGQSLGEAQNPGAWSDQGLRQQRDWLKIHGPTECRGCEPINAALGEGRIDLEEDPLGF